MRRRLTIRRWIGWLLAVLLALQGVAPCLADTGAVVGSSVYSGPLLNAVTATGASAPFDVGGLSVVACYVAISATATVAFQGTVDGTNWVTIQALNLNSGATATTTTATGLFQISVAGLSRIRFNVTAYTSGTVTATARGIVEPGAAVVTSAGGGGGGSVTQGTSPWVDNLSQIAGANINVGNGTAAGSQRVTLASDSTGQVTANAGTNLNTSSLALDTSVNGVLLAQGSTTSGQKGPVVQGAVTTGAPTYTTAQTSPLSLTTAGALRTDASATTQPVSGTVTANAGTGTMGVNLAQVAGATVTTGNGTSAGAQRVTISSDSTGQVALATGTNSIGNIGTVTTLTGITNALPAGTNTLGNVIPMLSATVSGWTPYENTASTNTVTEIKSTAGKVGYISCVNLNSAPIYIQWFNVAHASITLGTTAPTFVTPVPANGTAADGAGYDAFYGDTGIAMGTAIDYAVTTTSTGSTAPGTASPLFVLYQ